MQMRGAGVTVQSAKADGSLVKAFVDKTKPNILITVTGMKDGKTFGGKSLAN